MFGASVVIKSILAAWPSFIKTEKLRPYSVAGLGRSRAKRARDDLELLQHLLRLELFPIKDSYIPYLRRDRTALKRNPATVKRICGRLYEMGLDEMGLEKIWARSSEPKETNRQIGPLFRRWLKTLGLPLLSRQATQKPREAVFDPHRYLGAWRRPPRRRPR